jgi:hypothetical protein
MESAAGGAGGVDLIVTSLLTGAAIRSRAPLEGVRRSTVPYAQVLNPASRHRLGIRRETRRWILIGLAYAAALAVIVATQITAEQLVDDAPIADTLILDGSR